MIRTCLLSLLVLLLAGCGGSDSTADSPAGHSPDAHADHADAKPADAKPADAKPAEAAPAKVVKLADATVTVGCSMCQFKMEGSNSCEWAITIGETPYLIEGALPADHDTHAADGICKTTRTAVVDGELKDGKFIATRMDLKPHEGAAPGDGHAH